MIWLFTCGPDRFFRNLGTIGATASLWLRSNALQQMIVKPLQSPGTQLIQVADTRDVSLALTGAFSSAEEKVAIVQAPAGKKLQATVKTFGT